MRSYQHLNLKERVRIFHLLKRKYSVRKIAKKLSRAPSTISREIRRFKVNFYAPGLAQEQYKKRKSFKRQLKILSHPKLRGFIHRGLKKSWSPEQISGRLRCLNSPLYVCHETIYRFIYRAYKGDHWYKYLAKRKSLRGKRSGRKQGSGKYHFLLLIDQRPERGEDFGHWEGDRIGFHTSRYQNVTTLVEWKSKTLMLIKNFSKKSQEVMRGIRTKMRSYKRKKDCLSVTLDQGSEFAPSSLSKSEVDWQTYYCHPHSPWERGFNENMNGRLRRDLPRDLNIEEITQEDLDCLSRKHNRTPRKILGYKTPNEVWKERTKPPSVSFCLRDPFKK